MFLEFGLRLRRRDLGDLVRLLWTTLQPMRCALLFANSLSSRGVKWFAVAGRDARLSHGKGVSAGVSLPVLKHTCWSIWAEIMLEVGRHPANRWPKSIRFGRLRTRGGPTVGLDWSKVGRIRPRRGSKRLMLADFGPGSRGNLSTTSGQLVRQNCWAASELASIAGGNCSGLAPSKISVTFGCLFS